MYSYLFLLDNRLGRFLWRMAGFCRRGWHLWDEVLSGVDERHYLTCDACGEEFIGHDWREPNVAVSDIYLVCDHCGSWYSREIDPQLSIGSTCPLCGGGKYRGKLVVSCARCRNFPRHAGSMFCDYDCGRVHSRQEGT